MFSRYLELDAYTKLGLEYQCQTQTAPPPASRGFTVPQKLSLQKSYRPETRLIYAKSMAVMIEGKKQQLHQGISAKKRYAPLY
jgi:hypothetical protein